VRFLYTCGANHLRNTGQHTDLSKSDSQGRSSESAYSSTVSLNLRFRQKSGTVQFSRLERPFPLSEEQRSLFNPLPPSDAVPKEKKI